MSRFRAYPLLLSVVISCAIKNRRKGNINVTENNTENPISSSRAKGAKQID